MRLALFDLDHTLIPLDSDYEWGVFTTALGWNDTADFARRNEAFYQDYKAGTLDIHAYVRFATAAFCRRGPTLSLQAHARFMQEVIIPAISAQALALVRGHQAAGDRVVVVTATNEFVTRPIAEAFGVRELIAIELKRDSQSNWYTGEIEGTPSFREGKVVRVQNWLAAQGLGWDDAQITFYSDSCNDLPLLERVNHPVATNPEARLRELALARHWRVLDLFEPVR